MAARPSRRLSFARRTSANACRKREKGNDGSRVLVVRVSNQQVQHRGPETSPTRLQQHRDSLVLKSYLVLAIASYLRAFAQVRRGKVDLTPKTSQPVCLQLGRILQCLDCPKSNAFQALAQILRARHSRKFTTLPPRKANPRVSRRCNIILPLDSAQLCTKPSMFHQRQVLHKIAWSDPTVIAPLSSVLL